MNKYRGNLIHVAEAVRSHGRGGDDVLLHVNPDEFKQMQKMWGEPSYNPHTGLPEYGLFSKIKKALKFEAFNVKNIVKGVLKNPQRLLTGAVDPLGTKISNKMFGSHYDPLVNQLGGATEQRFRDAEAQGMDTGLARNLHKAAGVVAGAYGVAGLGNLAGNAYQAIGSQLGQGAGDAAAGLSEVTPTVSRIGDAALPSLGGGAADAAAAAGDAASLGNVAGGGSLLGKIGNYAKDYKNWPTILKGLNTVSGLVSNLGGGGGGGGGAAPDPGYQYTAPEWSRDFNAGDYDKYAHYGEGAEHQYYTPGHAEGGAVDNYFSYGPMPEDVWPPSQPALARGGSLGRQGGEGPSIGGNLSSEPRYVQSGPGGGRGDEIDAKLSPKEYVMDAETVALAGDGDPDEGARQLDHLRKKLRMHKGRNLAKGKFSHKAKPLHNYMRTK